jgi:hypothetical protein
MASSIMSNVPFSELTQFGLDAVQLAKALVS